MLKSVLGYFRRYVTHMFVLVEFLRIILRDAYYEYFGICVHILASIDKSDSEPIFNTGNLKWKTCLFSVFWAKFEGKDLNAAST